MSDKGRYDHDQIELRWQRVWEDQKTFKVSEDSEKPKYYVLDMFPYPSGDGLHVGHPEGYTATDIMARYKRMIGFNVLHPMGWDAFGLPAERHAMRTGTHPAVTTKKNTDTFRRQIKRLGFSYDWDREVNTTDPDYYKFTQWIFLQLYKKGLAYQEEVAVNWCPAQGTVLANEEVKDGRYVETGDPVEKRVMKQWMLKITAYAQRLLDDLDDLDWPEGIKAMQRNWIGRSDGADVTFRVAETDDQFVVFTTRPDTLYGATYCVLAPEHTLVERITGAGQREAVQAYVQQAAQKTDRDRTDDSREKTGVFTGAYAVNPVNGGKLPIWVADYVLIHYGSGAIMAVPGHDQRDWDFARAQQLPIVEVVSGGDVDQCAYDGDGQLVNSGMISGMTVEAGKQHIVAWLEAQGLGKGAITYRLRDWLFSRQRYWGEPFPVIHLADGTVKALREEDLPVLLPDLDQYRPTDDGRPPLARATEWLDTVDPESGQPAVRETNTMPQWAGSCWYYLRYIDPRNLERAWDADKENYWMPVDLYVGGAEHAVLHLLYARFWHKVLYDCGHVSTREPFQKLYNQGMILAHSYRAASGKYYYPHQVSPSGDGFAVTETGEAVETLVEKMSKSKYNVVNPDEVIAQYGADAMRAYEMFMGPLDRDKSWSDEGIQGVYRFLKRTWRFFIDELGTLRTPCADWPDETLKKAYHKTVKAVAEHTESMKFNTGLALMMELLNLAYKADAVPLELYRGFVLILAPYCPHLAEELWARLGHSESLAYHPWPEFDPALCIDDVVTVVIQVNGKLRARIDVARGTDKSSLEREALALENVTKYTEGKTLRKVIIVPDKLVNIVVS